MARLTRGFTMLEMALMVVIFAILASMAVVASVPQNETVLRNVQRNADVLAITNAVYEWSLEHDGTLPPGITKTPTEICETQSTNCQGLVNLSPVTAGETYLDTVPKDPLCNATCSPFGTGYRIYSVDGRLITVTAPAAELENRISVTR